VTVGLVSFAGSGPDARQTLMGGFAGFTFINFAKQWQSMSNDVTAANPPTRLNSDGYPTSPFSFGGVIPMLPASEYNGSWVVKWTGGLAFRFLTSTNVTVGGSFVTGGGAGSGNTDFSGTSGRVVLSFVSVPALMSVGFTGVGASGGGGLVICRLADEASVDAGEIFLPEFIANMRGLNLKAVRAMGWCTSSGSDGTANSNYAYRWPTTALSYTNTRFPSGAWAGTASTADNIAYTCGNAPDSNAAAYVQGETIQVAWPAAANATTAPTLSRNGLAAKAILNTSGAAISIGAIAASKIATFVYDDILGSFLFQPDGIITFVPIEVHVALANRLRIHLWKIFPILYTDASVAAEVAYIRDNLNSNLNCYLELSNETWNASFIQNRICSARGLAFGFPNNNNRPASGYFGYRTRQIMANATTTWTTSRARAQLKCVMPIQSYGVTGTGGSTNVYRLQGADLVGATYAAYLSYNGGIDPGYNSFPNRPIDVCDVISHAPYFSGAQCTNFDANYIALGAANIAGLLSWADDYAGGNTTLMAAALASFDNDVRAGTTASGGTLGTNTISHQNTNIFPAWETVSASYDGAGRPSGRPNLTVEQYENAYEGWYPSTSACTTMGISTAYGGAGGKIDLLIQAWKSSTYGYNIVKAQADLFFAQTHSKTTAWLQLSPLNQWSLLNGDMLGAPFQIYYGFANYHS
jgi:hypothetical protein